MNNKSRSLGRKPTDKQNMIGMPYGQNNIRDSSVSNTSNPAGSSNLAGYTSVGQNKKQFGASNSTSQYNMMNNFIASNLPQTFYNQVSINNVRGGGNPDDSNYSYEINLNAVNKSLGTNNNQNI